MSKIRDALANDVKSMGFVQAFQEGWDAALKHAPEVTAFVEAASNATTYWDCPSCSLSTPIPEVPCECRIIEEIRSKGLDELKQALTQWKESTTKKREE